MSAENVLRIATWQAAARGYHGPGDDWGRAAEEHLTGVIERGEHLPVLRSADFAHCLFAPRLVAQVYTGEPLHYQNWEDVKRHAEELQHQLIAADDPLGFLKATQHDWLR
jgi:hypothetical protein